MCENLDERFLVVGGPHADCAVLVSDVQDSIVRVLAKGSWGALLCGDLSNEFAGTGVLVLQPASISDGGEEEVKGQELHVCDVDVILQRLDLDTLVVVDIDVLLLSDGEELIVVQPLRVANCFA